MKPLSLTVTRARLSLSCQRARYQKLEKAEILEMTVNYIRNLKRTMNNTMDEYDHGYRQCSEETWKLIHSLPNLVPEQRERLAVRCRQVWTNRRYNQHPYQRRGPPSSSSNTAYEPYPSQQSSSCLKILINHSSLSNTQTPCPSTSSSCLSSNSLGSSSPKLWKPYM